MRPFTRALLPLLVLALPLLALPACSASSRLDAAVSDLASIGPDAELGCSPLRLNIVGADEHARMFVSSGSGVLLHPRLVLTASHVVPEGSGFMVAIGVAGKGRATSHIRRIIRGSRRGFWDGDWALVILDDPTGDFPAAPTARLLGPGEPAPPPGAPIRIAGFPFSQGSGDANARDEILVTTSARPSPEDDDGSPALFFARTPDTRESYKGASGGPALATDPDGRPVLLGIYSGTTEMKFVWWRYDRTMTIQRLPTELIRQVIEELDNPSTSPLAVPVQSPPESDAGSPSSAFNTAPSRTPPWLSRNSTTGSVSFT